MRATNRNRVPAALADYLRHVRAGEPDLDGRPLPEARNILAIREDLNRLGMALSAAFESLSAAQRALGLGSAAPERPSPAARVRRMTAAERRERRT